MVYRADPFPHWVIDDYCDATVDPNSLPPAESEFWEARYANSLELNKRTTRKFDLMPPEMRRIFHQLRSDGSVAGWAAATGIDDLVDDPTAHGGGAHCTSGGGHLSVHLDYAAHPHMPGMERRINLIYFLNPEWKEEWGGALVLCDLDGKPVERVYPKPGRLAAFVTDDTSYHGVEPVTGPVARLTAACYFLAPIRPGVTRRRALFVPNRG